MKRTPKQRAADANRARGYGWQALIWRPRDDHPAESRAEAQEALDALGPDWLVQEAIDPSMGVWLIRIPAELGARLARGQRGVTRRAKSWRVEIELP